MSILYEDEFIVCDDDALTIHWYYFPFGSKRIPYTSITQIKDEPMSLFSGVGRIWGMGLTPEWFHLDPKRPSKSRYIIVDDGHWVKSAITPINHEAVAQILREKTSNFS